MKSNLSSQMMDIPEGVTVKVKAKIVEVEGPRGKLTRDFKHLNLDFELIEGGKKLKVDAWFGSRKTTAAIRTSLSHIDNLITGVTKGYRYKMRLVYAHFPINASITPNNSCIEIRNFLGEKKVRSFFFILIVGVVLFLYFMTSFTSNQALRFFLFEISLVFLRKLGHESGQREICFRLATKI
ncbi:60S ribosomal protein L9-like [Zingiber officinale]|uniref:60S ribosomal protein L9-like n=1 Tax=Zingiber officinale TaxID=94328 RepID=UPI001C4B114E|nr:60S ribosomal protein L9-like [Zingiber officinale]